MFTLNQVPGEMFSLAMSAKKRGMGVVGSTSNILDFIAGKVGWGPLIHIQSVSHQQVCRPMHVPASVVAFALVAAPNVREESLASPTPTTPAGACPQVGEALGRSQPEHLQFVLGTEAGMITSIVRKVQHLLKSSSRKDVTVEIVFPVSPKSITTAQQTTSAGAPVQLPGGLSVLPGPASGEGCSLEGGCAACPYMRMNTLQALTTVCERVGSGAAAEAMLEAYKPRPYADKIKRPDGSEQTVAQAGCVPILHMRHFQQKKELPQALIDDMNRVKMA